MAKQTFTSGQVLTAAQMTSLQANDYNQTVSAKTANYVLVASDAGTTITMSSATATTVTVNTSLFTAGDTLRIQNLNGGGTCTVTAGTATVTSAGSLVIPSWGGGTLYFTSASAAIWFPNASAPGLVRVGGGALTGSSVTFSNVFSALYDNYVISLSNVTSTANAFTTMRLGATTTGYYNSVSGAAYTNSAQFDNVCYMGTSGAAGTINLGNPFLAKFTVMSALVPNLPTNSQSAYTGGFLNNTTSYTDFSLSGGTFTAGTVNIYGYTLS